MNIVDNKQSINFSFLLGFFDADGGFEIIFKKDNTMILGWRIQPIAKWTQRDITLLKKIKFFLENNGFPTVLKENKKRGSSLAIEGIQNVQNFVNMIFSFPSSFYGMKYYDLILMKQLFLLIEKKVHNTDKGRKEILDIKFNLHTDPDTKTNLDTKTLLENLEKDKENEEDVSFLNFKKKNKLSRDEWEKRHGFPVGSSVSTAQPLYAKKTYEKLKLETMQKIQETSLEISGEYISGVISGDGALMVSIRKDQKTKRFIPRFGIRFQVTVGIEEKLMLEVVAYYFSDFNPSILKRKEKAAYNYLSRVKVIPRLLNHSQKYPIIGKEKQVELISKVWVYNQQKKVDEKESKEIAKMIYSHSSQRTKRKEDLSTVLKDFDFYFKKKHLSLNVS